MPRRKLSQEKQRKERERRLGQVLVELVRVANASASEVQRLNQQELINRIKRQYGGKKMSTTTMSSYINDWLRQNKMGRVWIASDGVQKLTLAAPDKILRDSKSIRALRTAIRMADKDSERFPIQAWADHCKNVNGDSDESCEEYLEHYRKCGYIVNGGPKGTAELDMRRINDDMFYLRQAQYAKLKAPPKRREVSR